MVRRSFAYWVGLALAFLLVVLFIFYPPFSKALRSGVGSVSSFVAAPISGVARAVNTLGTSATHWLGAFREAERLRTVEERLVFVEAEYAKLQTANETLMQALEIGKREGRRTVAAEVIGSFYEGRDEFLVIKESSGAVSEGAVVLSPQGVILGVIRTTASNTATVRLLSSPSETITVAVYPSGVNGVLRGDNNGEYLISLVAKDAAVNPGDVVVSIGRNAGVPSFTPVGAVVNVSHSPTESFLDVRAKAPMDVATLSQVIIILE
ncbi:MAG: rod shape-determining protein MreC [Candidatus Sungbacteria bacterium]|nr:rod shape-determining protein MreC [Candidatus Sungbacteria bacterium]